MKPINWIVSGEVGTSSKTIWAVMMDAIENQEDIRGSWEYDVPHDPDDFSRCWKLLNLFPEWRKRLHEVSAIFPAWVGFVREWDILTKMYEDNRRTNQNGNGYSKEMYDFMVKLEDEGRLADGWTQDGPNSWHRDNKVSVKV